MSKFEKRFFALAFLNFVDLVSTYYIVILTKQAEELNPLMDYLIKKDPFYFIAYKLLAMIAILFIVDKSLKTRSGFLAYSILLVIYSSLGLVHLANFLF
jgi:hypothetical protein